MEKDLEPQVQKEKETVKEIYQPKPEIVCDLKDKECIARYLQVISDCV